ncbi:MAG TPA: surface-adhesin E family protein [Gemmatimonadaceae bacterium]|jgi:hypothetical protein
MTFRTLLPALVALSWACAAAGPAASTPEPDNALADRWLEVGVVKSNQATVYIDTVSLDRHEDVAAVWMMYRYETNHTDALGKNYRRYLVHETINCARRTVAADSWATYTASGSVVMSGTMPPRTDAVPPGSVIEAVMLKACRPTSPPS